MRKLYLSLVCCLITVCVQAKIEIRSTPITMADGMLNSTVRHFLQDSKGFIWMGTLNGLNRYDGNSFIHHQPSPHNPLSLADQKILELHEDVHGFLWIRFSSEDVSCYDLRRDCFVDFTGRREFRQKYSKRMEARNGNTWLWHASNGARRVVYENGQFTSTTYGTHTGKLVSNAVNFVFEGLNGDIWLGCERGLLLVRGGEEVMIDNRNGYHTPMLHEGSVYFFTHDNRLIHFDETSRRLNEQTHLPANEQVTSWLSFNTLCYIFTAQATYAYNTATRTLIKDPDLPGGRLASGSVITDNRNNAWVYNHTGRLWYFDRATDRVKVFTLFSPQQMGYIDLERYRIVHDSRNIIWISTYGNGLFAYDLQNDELNHYRAGMNTHGTIGSDYLLDIMQDRSGEIWVSSEFTGVNRISVISSNSRRYFPENPELLDRSNTIRMVAQTGEGEIRIGTRKGGLYVYDEKPELKSARTDFSSNIYATVKDSEGTLWLGSRSNGLLIGAEQYRNNPADPASLSNNNIFCMHRDCKNRMWIGTFGGGLNLAERVGARYVFRHFLNDTPNQKFIRAISEDTAGYLWVATSDGLYVFNPDRLLEDATDYRTLNYTNGSLLSNEVKSLFADSKGNVWIGTSGAGISMCTPDADHQTFGFEHYNSTHGLSNDVVQSIIEDNAGHIWIGTEYGISKFAPREKIFENYFLSPHALGNVYTEGAVTRLPDGRLVFGTNHGFVVFNPALVRKHQYSPPVVFTNLNVNGTNMLPADKESPLTQSLAYTGEVRLKHYQNSIVVDFSSFNYADEHTKYMYRLTNYDKGWSTPSTLNFAAYKMLPPGKYELQVKSANGAGVWNSEVATLALVITPPFYLSSWAFLIYAVLLGVILYFAFRITRNFNRLQNKIAVETRLTEYKLVFFTNISHEFRTPLTLIQGALERIRRLKSVDKELGYPLAVMEKNTRRMLRLIDQLLEFRKMQNNKLALSLEKTDVVAMLYEIFLSFGDMAESKNMDFRFVPSVTAHKMFVDKGKLDKIVYNLLSNAFKYTPQGGTVQLIVQVNTECGRLEISVTDTGVGIPKEKQSQLFSRFMQSNFSGESVGIGLHLTHELVTVHKGEITYRANEETGGSVFMVSLPLGTELYEDRNFLIANNVLMQEKSQAVVEEKPLPTLTQTIKPDPLNRRKVLIIEDNPDVRQYLKEELSPYFELLLAENGLLGFELAVKEAPDLIVCDVIMPEMNGYEVTRKLKAEFQTSHIPVILLTALSTPENHLEGIESGAEAYISKPFSIRLLLTRIIKILEQRERLRENFSEEPGIVRSVIYTSDRDKEFVDEVHRVLEANLDNPSFTVDEFAAQMHIGRTVFYKKMKGITGHSPNEYLRIMRMKKAAALLQEGKLSVAEVSYSVGIEDPFYFSKCFKTQFGLSPSAYQKGQPGGGA